MNAIRFCALLALAFLGACSSTRTHVSTYPDGRRVEEPVDWTDNRAVTRVSSRTATDKNGKPYLDKEGKPIRIVDTLFVHDTSSGFGQRPGVVVVVPFTTRPRVSGSGGRPIDYAPYQPPRNCGLYCE